MKSKKKWENKPIPEDEEIICNCYMVGEKTIRDCIEAGNLKNIEEITEACDAGGGCHTCHILLQLFIDDHQEKLALLNTEPGNNNGKPKKTGFLKRIFG
jgi:bacterioferritin-associated ferredoxin